MPVPGPRQRAPPPRQSAAPSARNEVFENIFGRPSGAHHLGHPGQPHANPHPGLHPGPPPGHPGYPPGGLPRQAYDRFDPYAQYAPPPPPPQQQPVYNPAQPSYPPGQGNQGPPRPQSTQPYPPAYQQRPQRTYPPQPQPQQHPQQRFPDPYRPAPPYDGQGQANGRLQQQYTGNSQADSMSNRRASFAPSISVTPNFTSTQSGYNPAQGPNPSQQQQPNGGRGFNNGYSGPSERLPPITSLHPPTEDPYGGIAAGGPSIIQPKPRSSSATTNISSTSSTATITSANVPPRSRSLHNQTGRGGIRLTIPSGGPQPPPGAAQPGVPGHPVALQDAQGQVSVMSPIQMPPTPDRADTSPPPDYLQAFNAVSLNSSGRRTPGPLDDIEGIPDRQSADLGLLHGPWDQEHSARPGPSVRQSSSSASSFSTNHRRRHSRMPSDSSIASSVYTVSGQRMAPLSQIGATGTPDSPFGEPTTPTGSENGYGNLQHRLSARKSMESTHSLPLPATVDSPLPPGAANSVYDHRAMSFSGTGVNRRDIVEAVRAGSLHGRSRSINNGGGSPVTAQRSFIRNQSSAQLASTLNIKIIPSLLSNVAEAFRQLIQPGELLKEGITYKDAFDGRTAVSIIADIIKTPDRNLALLLGRALDAQRFFHDVTYAHRLRDTPNEVYQFKERLVAPFMPGDASVNDSPTSDQLAIARPSSAAGIVGRPRSSRHNAVFELPSSDSHTSLVPASPAAVTKAPSLGVTPVEPADDSDDDLPNGVFTLLTTCYSPTCSREQLCYSINCPRRLEQMKRLNMKSTHLHPGLNRKIEDESLADDKQETGTLWIHSVPQEIVDSVDDREKKRQEAINEVIYTERDFVRGLEYLRDSWIKPLRSNDDVIEASRRDDFVRQVFWNVHDVLTVNLVLAERLTKRQKQQPVVQAIGDIFMDCVPHFEPFVVYGAHQLFGKYEFEKEKGANPAFQKFVDETERKPESRKLELNGYLTKPTTRLGRYPLLLEAVLKYTPDDHPDKKDLPEVIKQIRAFLEKVNIESGKSENIFELAQIEQQLSWSRTSAESPWPDLLLRDKNRELLHKGPMKRRGAAGNPQGGSENADLLAFLFDHAFLLVKPKWVNKAEQYKVYRRPVPLELLVVTTPEDVYNSTKLSASSRGNKLISRNASKGNSLAHVPPKPDSKHGYSITVTSLGRRGWSLQLWVDTYVGRKKWIECIDKQQQVIRDKNLAFVPETITDSFFQGLRRINCISPYDNGNRMIYGTDEGVYFSNLRDPKLREPVKVINLLDVTQVDVIEEFQLLLVLHERSVTTFPLDCLDPNDPNAALKRGKRVSSHTSFFKSGICLGRTLIAVVKSSPLSSTIKVLEPIDQNMRGKKPQTGFMKRLNGGQETLKLFKEFYIPLESFSVHFLKTKLCVGCQKGFEIVDLETLDMQSLLDPSDSKLDFVLKRDGPRPMAIFRIEGDFLLCYDYFAFYVNKSGWRSRLQWSIVWESAPTAFALQYPYVIAFDPSFIEVRHVESGTLVQTFAGSNIRCLFADMPPSTVNAPMMGPNRQLMYPGPQQTMYRPPPQAMGYPGQPPPQIGFPTPHTGTGFRPPPMPGYGMPPPMAPMRNFAFRPQIIFTSDDGHVQFLKLAPPNKNHQNPNRRLSDSRSVHSMRAV